jgi:hypothetical protein
MRILCNSMDGRSVRLDKSASLEFDRPLRSEPEKLVKLFGMKNLTIRINNVDLPSSLKQSPTLRHGNNRAGIKRPLALLAVF